MRRADRSLAATRRPRRAVPSLVPDPLDRVAPSTLLAAALRGLAPKPVEVQVDHIAPIRASVARCRRGRARRPPGTRSAQLPPARRRRADAARGHRALPRRPRAVQAGRRRPRPGRDLRRSAACAVCGRARRPSMRPASPTGTSPRAHPRTHARRWPRSPSSRVRRPARRSHPKPACPRGAPGRRGRGPGGDRARRAALPRAARRAPGRDIEELCRELAAEYDDAGRGFVLAKVAGGYRFQTHPDLAPYVERFVLEGQHVAAVRPGARDARDRRLQAAHLARTDLRDPRRQRRSGPEHAPAARLHEEVGRDPGPGHAVLYGTTPSSSNASGSTRSPTCRRSATSCPTRASSRRSSARCARVRRPRAQPVDDDPDAVPGNPAAAPRANGSRRCWPGPGSVPAGPARS